jgi:hypothetical protein
MSGRCDVLSYGELSFCRSRAALNGSFGLRTEVDAHEVSEAE